MAKSIHNSRVRLLVLRDLLAESDEAHPIPLSQIKETLEKAGLSATRKSLYRDMDALKRSPLRVRYRKKQPQGWYATHEPPAQQAPRQILDRICAALQTQRALAFRLGREERPCLVSPSGVVCMGKRVLFLGQDLHTSQIQVVPLDQMKRVVVSGYPCPASSINGSFCSVSLGQQSSGK